MLDITFISTGDLRFQSEPLAGTRVDTTHVPTADGTYFNLNPFSPTSLATRPAMSSVSRKAPAILRVTNFNGELEVSVPGESYPSIPANSSVVITYPRVAPLVRNGLRTACFLSLQFPPGIPIGRAVSFGP